MNPFLEASPGASQEAKPLSITELNRIVRRLLEEEVGPLWVEGEVSRPTLHASGHLYFTLKDQGGRVDAVVFRSDAARIRFDLTDGLRVMALGQPTVYEAGGRYQLVVRKLVPAGMGALELRLRQLKARLEQEGLFEAARKRPLPFLPRMIALVTSPTGAALRDILNVVHRRCPRVHLVLVPARVQGDGAAGEIAAALDLANTIRGVELIIAGRGGGSVEDLWCFNEEIVIYAIARSRVPVISAVGHEIDVTLADLVADLRAATPTEAAEKAVPIFEEVAARLLRDGTALEQGARNRVRRESLRVDRLAGSYALGRFPDRVRRIGQRLDDATARLGSALARRTAGQRARIGAAGARLSGAALLRRVRDRAARLRNEERRASLVLRMRLQAERARVSALEERLLAGSPQSILARGYSITTVESGGPPIRDASDLRAGARIVTRFARGSSVSRVEDLRRDDGGRSGG